MTQNKKKNVVNLRQQEQVVVPSNIVETQIALPLATVRKLFPGYKPFWKTETDANGEFIAFVNDGFGRLEHKVLTKGLLDKDTGEFEAQKTLYDTIVDDDGGLDKETGRRFSGSVTVVAVWGPDGIYLLVQEETRFLAKEDVGFPLSSGCDAAKGKPLVVTHTLPGGYYDPKKDPNGWVTALRELFEEAPQMKKYIDPKRTSPRAIGWGLHNRAKSVNGPQFWLIMLEGRHDIESLNEAIQRSPKVAQTTKEGEIEAENIKNTRFVRIDRINGYGDDTNAAGLHFAAFALGCVHATPAWPVAD